MDIEAESPVEAAKQALAVQRNPESKATVFEVVPAFELLNDSMEPSVIDLEEFN